MPAVAAGLGQSGHRDPVARSPRRDVDREVPWPEAPIPALALRQVDVRFAF